MPPHFVHLYDLALSYLWQARGDHERAVQIAREDLAQEGAVDLDAKVERVAAEIRRQLENPELRQEIEDRNATGEWDNANYTRRASR
jgi:hypothetical protein